MRRFGSKSAETCIFCFRIGSANDDANTCPTEGNKGGEHSGETDDYFYHLVNYLLLYANAVCF